MFVIDSVVLYYCHLSLVVLPTFIASGLLCLALYYTTAHYSIICNVSYLFAVIN